MILGSMDPIHAKIAAAATGSTLTALTMTPFDVVKTRLQTQPPIPQQLHSRFFASTCCQPSHVRFCVRNMSSLARSVAAHEVVCVWDSGVMKTERVSGFYDAVKHVWRVEGPSGLWKGVGTTLIIGVPSVTCYMLTYDYLLNVFLQPLIHPSALPLTAGILARATITTIASPLELIRTNLQSTPQSSKNPHTLRSTLNAIRSLVHSEGVASLWRGLSPTLWRDVPFSGIYWAGYESLKHAFSERGKSSPWVAFISGSVSGTTAALITSPFDVLKTRRQALLMSSSAKTTSLPLLAHIVRTEGPKALFAGIGPRIAKIAPACGIMISCYEGIGKALAR